MISEGLISQIHSARGMFTLAMITLLHLFWMHHYFW